MLRYRNARLRCYGARFGDGGACSTNATCTPCCGCPPGSSTQRKLAREHLQDFVNCYLPGKPRDERTETERFTVFDYEELAARDKANLDIPWLRDPDAEDSDNTPTTVGTVSV